MRALVLREIKRPLVLEDRLDLDPGENEVVVQLRAAALNRRDYWITQGMYPGIEAPVVLGSDGAGVVSKIGTEVSDKWLGQEVVINPGWDWGADEKVQAAQFHILGMPTDGTFASEVVVPDHYLHPKPKHLDWQQAAALPLAGMTAYRALFSQGRLKPGELVLISGIGGGVATCALQFALAAAAKVVVTSSSEAKISNACELGASAGFNYKTHDWHKQARSEIGSPNLIVDSAGGDGYANLLDLAAPGARVVNYGATSGPPKKVDLFKIFWKQLHVIGSTMGSPADFKSMLDFVNTHSIKLIVDKVYPLSEGNTALDRMRDSAQFGKLVLEIA